MRIMFACLFLYAYSLLEYISLDTYTYINHTYLLEYILSI